MPSALAGIPGSSEVCRSTPVPGGITYKPHVVPRRAVWCPTLCPRTPAPGCPSTPAEQGNGACAPCCQSNPPSLGRCLWGNSLVTTWAVAGVETGGGCPAWGAELAWPDACPCDCKGPFSEDCPGGGFYPLREVAEVRFTSAAEKCRLVGWIHLTPLCQSQVSCLPWPPLQPKEIPAFSGCDSWASLSSPPRALTSCGGCGMAATG